MPLVRIDHMMLLLVLKFIIVMVISMMLPLAKNSHNRIPDSLLTQHNIYVKFFL